MSAIRKSLLQLMFSGSYMRRWNDKLRPVELYEIDKQAHKMIVAWMLTLLNSGGYSASDQLISGANILPSVFPVNNEVDRVDGGKRRVPRFVCRGILHDFPKLFIGKDRVFVAGKNLLVPNGHNRLFIGAFLRPGKARNMALAAGFRAHWS